jgi:hypothetical protein
MHSVCNTHSTSDNSTPRVWNSTNQQTAVEITAYRKRFGNSVTGYPWRSAPVRTNTPNRLPHSNFHKCVKLYAHELNFGQYFTKIFQIWVLDGDRVFCPWRLCQLWQHDPGKHAVSLIHYGSMLENYKIFWTAKRVQNKKSLHRMTTKVSRN